jgi:hypothetical protein
MIQLGGPVKTVTKLSSAAFIAPKLQKSLRKPDMYGIVEGYPQQSNTVLVKHPGDPEPAIYLVSELEDAAAWWRVEHSLGQRLFFKEFDNWEELEYYLSTNGVSKRDALISPPAFGTKDLEEGFLEVKTFQETLLDDDL